MPTKLVAHRGCSEGKRKAENVLHSYMGAYQKLPVAECDIQRTRDGKLVLWHDNSLSDEATAKGLAERFVESPLSKKLLQPILDFSYEELNAVLSITRLSDVLKIIPKTAELLIEIKLPDVEVVPILLNELRSFATPAQVILISFHSEVIKTLKNQAPEYRVLVLTDRNDDFAATLSKIKSANADGVGVEYFPPDEKKFIELVKKLREQNILIQVWNLLLPKEKEKYLYELARSLEIDYCNTDYLT